MFWRKSLLLILSVALPALARPSEVPKASALQDAKGRVVISWSASTEPGNLGFNVYRVTAAGREQVNSHLISGAAFVTKRDVLRAGGAYYWNDEVRPGEFVQYEVEDVDIHGVSKRRLIFTPQLIGELPDEANTDTLADLGTPVGGAVFLSPRGIGASRYVASAPTRQQREQQWDVASQPAAKLMVTEEGWYRVTRSSLAAAGFDAGDTKKLALFTDGVEQPVIVTDDAVEFYGRGIDSISSGARAYWLVRDKGEKLRIRHEKAKKGAAAATSTPLTVSRVERFYFFTWLLSSSDKENFFGSIITPAGAPQELPLEHVDPIGTASFEIAVQGGTDGAHEVRFDINGHSLGTIALTSQDRRVANLSFPSAWLTEGANALVLTSLLGDYDLSVIESVRLTYPHRMTADGNALKVAVTGGSTVAIDGFTTAAIRALDVTDPAQPVAVEVTVSGSGASRTASLVAPYTGTRTILVVGDPRVLAPAQIVPNRTSRWNETTNSADLVIISPRALAPAADPLKVKRDSQGVATNVIDVEDVYDEFGFGVRSTDAIRAFLLHSRTWSRAPKYVLLLGDASFDPRNYLGLGTWDLIPTRMLPTTEMKTASDDWFSDFADNDLPQIAIGRLPARTVAQAQLMINRIANRDTTGNTRVAFVSDATEAYFNQSAHSLATLVPADLPTTFDFAPVAADFESLLTTYIGHGSIELWAAGSFTGTAASNLTNTKLPVLVGMTCLNAFFHDLYQVSMAEAFLTNPNGGAVAVWTSSSLTFPEPQMDLAHEFFRQAFAASTTIGDAAIRAKTATNDHDVRRSWILLGDPSMKLR